MLNFYLLVSSDMARKLERRGPSWKRVVDANGENAREHKALLRMEVIVSASIFLNRLCRQFGFCCFFIAVLVFQFVEIFFFSLTVGH